MHNPVLASGNPSLTYATGTAASSGDNTLIAAPGAGLRLIVYSLRVQNESATATTCILKNGATAYERKLLAQYGVIEDEYHPAAPLWLAANAALVLNLSGANSHGYSVRYRVEVA